MSKLSAGHTIGNIFGKVTDIIIKRIDNYFDNKTIMDSIVEKIDNALDCNEKSRNEIKIKLEDLSAIWLKYNNTFTSNNEEQQKKQKRVENVAAAALNNTNSDNATINTVSNNENNNQNEDMNKPAEITQKDSSSYELSAEANNFYTDCIEPYRTILETRNVLGKIKALVEIVDRHGNCPSLVVMKDFRDEESDDLLSIAGLLARVTAKNHIFRVVRIALRLLKDEYKLPDAFIPNVIVAALGHDIGKFPEYRKDDTYSKLDHPVISAKVVATVIPQTEITWITPVLEAIRAHHSNINNNNDMVLILLKDADGRAREEEVTKQSPALKSKPLKEWFDVGEFLGMVRPHINVTQTNNRWGAFSHDGVVYVNPEFMFQLANEYAIKKEIINIQLIQRKNLEKVVKDVVKILYDSKKLTPDMKENWHYRRYSIETQMGKKVANINLIPIVESNFANVDEIERIKDSISDNIVKVEAKTK
ncbi:MAG TPA: HD domain-containing protein [Syntrophorhabdaceae bacterium]|nr:HD domain-containing protein [Syntrophorhabdaceae bacterium]HQP51381.1 HD domain-containing protein [Syntrophorhabdaceae bacterium]